MRSDETYVYLVGPKLDSALEQFVEVLGVSAPRQSLQYCVGCSCSTWGPRYVYFLLSCNTLVYALTFSPQAGRWSFSGQDLSFTGQGLTEKLDPYFQVMASFIFFHTEICYYCLGLSTVLRRRVYCLVFCLQKQSVVIYFPVF